MENNRKGVLEGNLACFTAYLIFGFNIICCKNIANNGLISPMALYLLRALGALTLFLTAGLVFRKSFRVEISDIWKIAIASFLGMFLTQFSFLKAITMTTAIDASIMSVLSPVMTMVIAAIVIKDRISVHGVAGLALSLAGVLFLILNTRTAGGGADHTTIGGIMLMLVNTLSFATYVGVFKPLIQKYSVITFMTWMFMFSSTYALPFGFRELVSVPYQAIPASILWQTGYVIIGATFISYFLIPFGQKRLRPFIVCMYSYVQPVVAMVISLAIGLDIMTWQKGLATFLVFLGVAIVNHRVS
ncbi:MAG: DMT family transporter [Bacteroidales bacterium]|nr:DMT family transporter [Bacteroidales bacterium]